MVSQWGVDRLLSLGRELDKVGGDQLVAPLRGYYLDLWQGWAMWDTGHHPRPLVAFLIISTVAFSPGLTFLSFFLFFLGDSEPFTIV